MFFDEHSTRIWWFATKINNGSHLALDDIKIAVLDRLLIQKLVNLGKAARGCRLQDIPPQYALMPTQIAKGPASQRIRAPFSHKPNRP